EQKQHYTLKEFPLRPTSDFKICVKELVQGCGLLCMSDRNIRLTCNEHQPQPKTDLRGVVLSCYVRVLHGRGHGSLQTEINYSQVMNRQPTTE
ncbi:hypothetical protein UPYG_G00005690, partial [Umbra pygmaea]